MKFHSDFSLPTHPYAIFCSRAYQRHQIAAGRLKVHPELHDNDDVNPQNSSIELNPYP
jgi:hypothetical protein